jgi:hypothetical protein
MTNVKINNWFFFCFSGRRMGGNNTSTLERICAECQGKMARFEIVRIKGFNFYKKATSTHTYSYTLFLQHNYTQHLNISNCMFEVCIVVELHAAQRVVLQPCILQIYNLQLQLESVFKDEM